MRTPLDWDTMAERLDRLEGKLDRIAEISTRQEALTSLALQRLEAMSRTIFGNGDDGLLCKVERLETVGQIGSRGFWAMVSLVSAIVSGTIVTLTSTLWQWLR
ncbi:MAG: hypothetical protein NZ602_14320 [Thermoguttaceae bacterium]|nr:hypothetical protein [Thermoguttaceae bacterium]MDW8039624.1 hypothetical protein [Thermoguttaceae bacterium]